MSWQKQIRLSRKWIHPVLREAGLLTSSILCTVFLFAGKSIGAGEAEAAFPQGDMGTASLKMGAALFLVIGMIFGLYYLSKKMRDGRFLLHKYPAMRVIGSLSLAPKRSIALVEVCGEWLVLGIGTESITLLRRIEDPPVNDTEAISAGGESNGSFQAVLRRKLKRATTGAGTTRAKDGIPG